MSRLSAVGAIRRVTPPWLRRTHAARLIEGCADVLDTIATRAIQGVKMRFPGAPPRSIDRDALALTGRERRIRRGPAESDAVYASRLVGWWDAHRTRGGPYALLRQLRAVLSESIQARFDVVYHSGTRRWIDTAGAITRDAITWNADGSDLWARFWVFVHVTNPATIDTIVNIVTQDGDQLITQDGDSIIGITSIPFIVSGAVSDEIAEWFRAIPREWSAAHVDRINVVLLYSGARLWGYPQPVPTWDEWTTWQDNSTGGPVQLTIEG